MIIQLLNLCSSGKFKRHVYIGAGLLRYFVFLIGLTTVFSFLSGPCKAQGTWTAVTNIAPHESGGGMILLSDGTVMCKTASGSDSYGNLWDRLTPDIHGSYVNG